LRGHIDVANSDAGSIPEITSSPSFLPLLVLGVAHVRRNTDRHNGDDGKDVHDSDHVTFAGSQTRAFNISFAAQPLLLLVILHEVELLRL